MQVFTEFIKSDLTEDQILPVLRDLLPVLLRILGSPEVTPFLVARHLSYNGHLRSIPLLHARELCLSSANA